MVTIPGNFDARLLFILTPHRGGPVIFGNVMWGESVSKYFYKNKENSKNFVGIT